MSIEVGTSLIPGTANTPLDARCRVTAISDIPNISNPFLGMEIYCLANSKTYKVTKLKSKMIGSMSVANGAVDEYEEIPDASAFTALDKRVKKLESGEETGDTGDTGDTGSTGTAGTGMLTVDSAEELSTVENAVIGQHIYITDPGKEVIVTGLADGVISATEDVPTRTEITDLDKRVKKLESGEETGDSGTVTASITTLMLTKPENGLFLIIRRAGDDGSRGNSTILIDTLTNAEDRKKVKGYLESGTDGSWQECPESGFSSPYDGAGIAVDLSGVAQPAVLFYAWATDADTVSDWQSVVFPSAGSVMRDDFAGLSAALGKILGE